MYDMLTCSMACFPYVMMWLGQVIIVGIAHKERKSDKADKIRGWKVTRGIFAKISASAGEGMIPRYPVLSPS